MSLTRRRRGALAVMAANTNTSSKWGSCGRSQKGMIVPAAQNDCVVSPKRMKKILAIRQQIADGSYDFDMRLDTVVERLIKELNI